MAPSWVQLGANFRQLGSILGVLGPAKIDQNRSRPPFVDFSSQAGPQELPDPLRTSIFSCLGVVFKSFFCYFSKDSCTTSALNFNAFGCFLQDFFFWSVLQKGPEGKWAAVFARRASSIIFLNIETYIHIYIYTNIQSFLFI